MYSSIVLLSGGYNGYTQPLGDMAFGNRSMAKSHGRWGCGGLGGFFLDEKLSKVMILFRYCQWFMTFWAFHTGCKAGVSDWVV